MKRFLSILLSLLMITGMFGAASAEGKATLTVMMSSGDFGPDTIEYASARFQDFWLIRFRPPDTTDGTYSRSLVFLGPDCY